VPRNVIRDQQNREQRIEQILDAAVYVIASKGIISSSMQDIAKAAKISIGNLYHYFLSKDELVGALLKRSQDEYRANVLELQAREGSALEKLRLLSEGWLATKENWAFTIIRQSARTSELVSPQIRRDVTDRFTANLDPIAEVMRQGQLSGEIIAGDAMQLAFYYVSLIQGLTLQKAPGYEVPVPIDCDAIVTLFARNKNEEKMD